MVVTRSCFPKLAFLLGVFVLTGLSHGQASDSVSEARTLETITLSFQGPDTSETAEDNPFTDTRLLVKLQHEDQELNVRGFYAADGDAAETSADSGQIWQCRVTLDQPGDWTYEASLRRGDWIAIRSDPGAGTELPLDSSSGRIRVSDWPTNDNDDVDFRRRGRVISDGYYFRMSPGGEVFLKCGANSPENLLAYADFDDTYRMAKSESRGEAKTTKDLHQFTAHLTDWTSGDPTWKDGKGKSLIGAFNYLSQVGMNSCYFLTMNIGGDGKDVWPYRSPDDFSRFDCSKLDQWEIVFEHMQRKGILLHIVTQETENETLLDEGDTGRFRQLYYHELISRFAHHPAVVWNLGEENGPANFSPIGQTPQQEMAMSDFFADADPYDHPVLIHSHAARDAQEHILKPLLGHDMLDGVSLQVSDPKRVHSDVLKWRHLSTESGHPWIQSMDEIGPAKRGAVPDVDDPMHDQVRGPVLWGSLMAGASGVEWYFGYEYDHNDLMAEDWRSRESLWQQTRIAKEFFESKLPLLDCSSDDALIVRGNGYCLCKPGDLYVVYRPAKESESKLAIDLPDSENSYRIQWFDPRNGGELQTGTVTSVKGGPSQGLGLPPEQPDQDWVILVRRDAP